MQGHRSSSLTTLPENLSFDHGSTDTSIDSQLPWNTIHPSEPNLLPSNDTNTQFFSHLRHNGHHSQWSLGEASSSASQNHAYGNEGKIEQHARSLHSPLENDNDVNLNGPHTTNGSFLLQNSTSEAISQDLNMNSTFDENEDDDCQIVEHPNTYISSNEDTSRRISCKRKALEVQVGQSSASASSSSFQNIERSQSQYQPIAPNNIITPTQTQTEQANPRLRLGVGGNPFSLTNLESSGRNLRVRINSLPHQEPPLATNPFLGEAEIGNRDVSSSSSRYSARLLRNHLLDVNPVPSMENGIPLDQYTPLRRNSQTRWSRGSSSRTSRASIPAISEPALTSIPIPRTISEHPIFIPPPANEMGSSSEHNTSWNLVGGGNNGNIGNAVSAPGTGSSSRPGSGSVGNISAADWARRYRQNYPRRLSEIARRSQLSSAGTESGLGGTNHGTGSSSSLTPQEMALLSGSHSHDRHAPSARAAMLERNVDGALGLPYSLRTFAAGSEGRSSFMSEQIRHVLNLMRRGEGLRIEDVMLLDHSVFFGMADIHDRHRDMRLDVDNMSYEELLALEERIGNVSTGLSEEAIINGLKQHNYYLDNKGSTRDQVETEPCSICREEYNDGEYLGRLECGHDFHRDCIKQWLVQKNSCPICKKAGLST